MASFDRAVAFVLRQEGDYVFSPRDPGGETRYGISKRTHPNVDITNLTLDGAKAIYKHDYWDALELDGLTDQWALFMFDSAVQHGLEKAKEFAAKNDLANALWARIAFYDSLATFATFGRDWIKRMIALRGVLRYDLGGQV